MATNFPKIQIKTCEDIITNGMEQAIKRNDETIFYGHRERLKECMEVFREVDPASYSRFLPYCSMTPKTFVPLT